MCTLYKPGASRLRIAQQNLLIGTTQSEVFFFLDTYCNLPHFKFCCCVMSPRKKKLKRTPKCGKTNNVNDREGKKRAASRSATGSFIGQVTLVFSACAPTWSCHIHLDKTYSFCVPGHPYCTSTVSMCICFLANLLHAGRSIRLWAYVVEVVPPEYSCCVALSGGRFFPSFVLSFVLCCFVAARTKFNLMSDRMLPAGDPTIQYRTFPLAMSSSSSGHA
jgi:hypothetical protein